MYTLDFCLDFSVAVSICFVYMTLSTSYFQPFGLEFTVSFVPNNSNLVSMNDIPAGSGET